jgi:hypothetical protein
MKQNSLTALTAIAVFTLVMFARSIVASPTFQACKNPIAQSQNATTPAPVATPDYLDCAGDFFEKKRDSLNAVSTAVIAIFTIALFWATRKQAQLTRMTLIADKRAFVFCPSFNQDYEPSQAIPGQFNWRFRPEWRNSGDTATNGLTCYSQCDLRNTPLPPGHNFQPNAGPPPATGLIGPKSSLWNAPAPFPPVPAITPQDIIDVQAGTKYLYLWGVVRYHDVFAGTQQHETRFCFQVNPFGNPLIYNPQAPAGQPGSLSFNYWLHSEGNSTDVESI